MKLVERHVIHEGDPRFDTIDAAAFASKNLYNKALYEIRQSFIFSGKYLSYRRVYDLMKDTPEYKALPAKIAQQVLKGLDEAWRSFFEAIASYRECPERFQGRPKLPKYKHKEGRHLLTYTRQAISTKRLKACFVAPSGLGGVEVKTKQDIKAVIGARVVPKANHYVLEVVYEKEVEPAQSLNSDWAAAIDIGLNNLAAITSNKPGFMPVLVNGRPLKSINAYYNKRKAKLTSILEQGESDNDEGDEKPSSRRLRRLYRKRDHKVAHYLHNASKRIIDLLIDEGVSTLVIGKNEGWKQESNLGKHTNQSFGYVPLARFVDMLCYKAELVGIEVRLQEESYTSKTSFLDVEPIEKQEEYAGHRVRRGLFRSASGKLVNADVNGSYNILRKAIPEAFDVEGIQAAVVRATRMSLDAHTSKPEMSSTY